MSFRYIFNNEYVYIESIDTYIYLYFPKIDKQLIAHHTNTCIHVQYIHTHIIMRSIHKHTNKLPHVHTENQLRYMCLLQREDRKACIHIWSKW